MNKQMVKKIGLFGLVAGVFVASQAHAALDTSVAAAITSVQTDAASLMPLLYTAMAAVTGGFVIFGLVKKGIRKVA
jgi:hypothetical protein